MGFHRVVKTALAGTQLLQPVVNRHRPSALGNVSGSRPERKYRERRSADHLVGDAAQQHPP